MDWRSSIFVECSNRTRSPRELFELLLRATRSEGFDQVAYGALTYREPMQLQDHPAPAVAMNFPDDWRDHYFARKYDRIDVVVLTPCLARPFLWSWLQQRPSLESEQRLIFDEARAAGLNNGISIPLHGAWGRVPSCPLRPALATAILKPNPAVSTHSHTNSTLPSRI